MKKLLMMALVVLGTSSAFAGDTDALKNIMKAKTYEEAASLLNANLGQLANDAEKARAYNKLVDLAYAAYNAQGTIVTENQLNKQMGKEEKPVDKAILNGMAYNAVVNALECDKYDQKPNDKGVVKPKFAEANAQRLWSTARFQLVNAGQDAINEKQDSEVLKYWGAFLDSDAAPLFAKSDRSLQAPFFGQVARFAAIYAYQAKDMDKANLYCDMAMKDSAEYKDAMSLKLLILKEGLKTREDSLNYVNNLKNLYEQNPDNDVIIENIYNMYSSLGDKASATKALDDVLARNPKNFIALANKGVNAMSENNVEEALVYLRKANEVNSESAAVNTYIGTCLCVQAQDLEDKAKKNALYEEALTFFEKAKQLDPDKIQSRWGYNRYNAYYNLYGEDDPRTKAAEAEK